MKLTRYPSPPPKEYMNTTITSKLFQEPTLAALIQDTVEKFEINRPHLVRAFEHDARILKIRHAAYMTAGFTDEQAFSLINK